MLLSIMSNGSHVLFKAFIKTINFIPNLYISKHEAMEILNLTNQNKEIMESQYKKLMIKNEGYTYLQSKIINAFTILNKVK